MGARDRDSHVLTKGQREDKPCSTNGQPALW